MPLQRESHDNLVFYRDSRWNKIKHGIFTRSGGVSPAPFTSLNLGGNVGDEPRCVRRNHERMYASLGVDDAQACTVWQVHGNDIVIAHGPVRGRRWLALADGLVTDRPGVALSMRFADCVPLLFVDPTRGVIGMAHAGWRGTVAGVGAKMVENATHVTLKRLSAPASALTVIKWAKRLFRPYTIILACSTD
jgi:copper oxidase (laccase) domain-containing protein